jgi:hypothetical protein
MIDGVKKLQGKREVPFGSNLIPLNATGAEAPYSLKNETTAAAEYWLQLVSRMRAAAVGILADRVRRALRPGRLDRPRLAVGRGADIALLAPAIRVFVGAVGVRRAPLLRRWSAAPALLAVPVGVRRAALAGNRRPRPALRARCGLGWLRHDPLRMTTETDYFARASWRGDVDGRGGSGEFAGSCIQVVSFRV